MLLAIDVGNTNIVFALCEGEEIRQRWRIRTEGQRTADEYAVWINQLMSLEGVERAHIDAAIIATVVPPALFNLQRLCRKYFHIEPLVVAKGEIDFGLKIDLPNPGRGRCRPHRQRRGGAQAMAGEPDRRRFRHGDDVRRGGG